MEPERVICQPRRATRNSKQFDKKQTNTREPWLLRIAACALVVLCALVVVFFPGPASAQSADRFETSDGEPANVTLEVVGQNTFVAAEGAMNLTLRIQGTTDDMDLSVVVHGRLSHEIEMDGPSGPAIVRLPSVKLDDLNRTGDGLLQVDVPIRSSDKFDDLDRALLKKPGVYPVTMEIRDANGPVTSARTYLVRLPVETVEAGIEPLLPVAILLTISTAEGMSAADVTRLLADHPTMPMTVLLGPGVVDQLLEDEATRTALVAALNGRPVLLTPTTDLDPSALAEIGQADIYASAAAADRQRIEALGMNPASGIGVLDAPLTQEGLTVLGDLGLGTVLDLYGNQTGSVRIRSNGRAFSVVRPDDELTAVLDRAPTSYQNSGTLQANRVLSRLVLRSQDETDPVIIGGPALGVDPVDTMSAVLAALTSPGGPPPIPLSDVTPSSVDRPAERPDQDLGPVTDLVEQIQQRLETFELMTGASRTGGSRARLAEALTRQRNPEDRARALSLLGGQVIDQLDVIELHEPQPVTLAARSAPLPVVLANEAAGPRRVLLRFRSDGLVSPDDGRIVELRPGTSSVDVTIEARSLGVSPLEVSVWTPDETTRLAVAQFEIRSTAVPGVGLAVSLLAVVLLAVWWYLDRSKEAKENQLDLDGPTAAHPEPAVEPEPVG